MKFFHRGKDGGPQSTVTGYWLAEIKSLCSAALLKFANGSRDNFHSHAFNSISWVLKGELEEHVLAPFVEEFPVSEANSLVLKINKYKPSWRPVITRRSMFHRVKSRGTSWVLTFRGPWANYWSEYEPSTGKFLVLEKHRNVVDSY